MPIWLPEWPVEACSLLHLMIGQSVSVMVDESTQLITIKITMEKRLFGVILTILGIVGLILAAYNFVQGNTGSNHSIKSVMVYGILGILFFFAGIGLIRSTRDLTNRN